MATQTQAPDDINPFEYIAKLSAKRGVTGINRLPGCWEVELGNGWSFALNGHSTTVKCSKGADVPAFNAYVEWQGTPVGFCDPYGGVFLGGDEGADEFNAALLAALESEQ